MAQYSVFTSDPEKLHLAQSSSDHHRRSSNLSSGRTNLNLQNRQWTYQASLVQVGLPMDQTIERDL